MEVNRLQNPAAAAQANGSARRAAVEGASRAQEHVSAPRENAVASVIVQQEFPPNTRLYLDEESNRIVAQVLDENNEVIRQIPPQELLEISARFNRLEGIIFDQLR